ncbi:GAF domain-containing protein [Chryseolinea sp. T2]|uniref:GAF domain-containing protein n=1 Tax=Chryseolinea sp. T2 TaxID=3129255 RepID=UPI00307776CB
MRSQFFKLTLPQRLALILVFPLITVLILSIWTFRHHLEGKTLALIALILIAGISAAIALLLVRKVIRSIRTVNITAKELSSGNFEGLSRANGFLETTEIGNHLDLVRQDVVRQTAFAEKIRSGNLDATYAIRHEQDVLGKALLDIKSNLISIKQEDEQRNWASEGLARFVNVLQSSTNLKAMSNDIIVNLVRIVKVNQGAIFLLAKDPSGHEYLEMQACYAYSRSKHLTQRVEFGEGLIGQAFLERETTYLREVPDNFMRITSGLGDANPRFVLIVPLLMNENIVGVLELASFKDFSKHEIEFVEKIGESIAFTVSSIRTAEQTQTMLKELNEQTEQMRAQEEELRQNQEELQATQETISRKYDTLFKKLGELNYQSKFDQLRSITSTKKRNVEYYFDIIRNQIDTFSEDRMVLHAMKKFREAFYQFEPLSEERREMLKKSVTDYYDTEFMPRLQENIRTDVSSSHYLPADDRALILQHAYISSNPHPTGKKSKLDAADDNSAYSQVHQVYHPLLRNFLEKFGYYDIFLIDASTGDMIYSVFKEVDFATSLLTGVYSSTNFGRVVKEAIDSTEHDFVKLIDFEPYDPSYHAPASFIAAPIYEGEEKIGILVFQMPINKINQILTGNNKWRDDGLGESGETFMVGDDYKLRSISRPLIEDLEEHIVSLQRLMYAPSVLQQIRKMETNILLEEVRQESTTLALKGQTGFRIEPDARGVQLLCSYAPLEISDVSWVIMSSMTEAEASAPINSLRDSSD